MQGPPPARLSDGDSPPVRTSNAFHRASPRSSHDAQTAAPTPPPVTGAASESSDLLRQKRQPSLQTPPALPATQPVQLQPRSSADLRQSSTRSRRPITQHGKPQQQQQQHQSLQTTQQLHTSGLSGSNPLPLAQQGNGFASPATAIAPLSPAVPAAPTAPSSGRAFPSPTRTSSAASFAPFAPIGDVAERSVASSTSSNASRHLDTDSEHRESSDAAHSFDRLHSSSFVTPASLVNGVHGHSITTARPPRTATRTAAKYSTDHVSDSLDDHSADRIAPNGIMDKPPAQPRNPVRRLRARSPWSASFLTLGISLVGAVLLGLILHSLVNRQVDPKGCRMSYMRPSYAHLAEFDTEHTRFASKYSLYLYREQGIDDENKLTGIPVLFIPGNAGSYKQVRPIAAETANFFHDVVRHDESAVRGGARGLDFFTVDFNEDITAFHGQTMLDQAEYLNEAIRYILSLYLDPRLSSRDSNLPDPTSVIVLGHSMGGIVARTMLIMPNYQSNSINTIVTLSAPHARPPVTFDGEIVQIYDDINSYWRHAYSQQWANNNPLWHVTLVSIAGGGLDTVVPSDYASLESLVPETHGFTAFTTTIPTVWTSMDHQAILWCDQFRKVIARALYDVVDVHRATQTKPRAERMRVFKKHFLTGMETIAEKDVPSKEPTTLITLEDNSNAIIAQGERLAVRRLGATPRLKAHLLPVPPPGSPVAKQFTLLTDQHLDRPGEAGTLEVLFCSVFPLQSGQAGVFPIKLDLSGESTGSTRLACKNAASDVVVLPASRRTSRHPFSLTDDRDSSTFSYLQYNIDQIADHQFVAVIDKASMPTPGFVLAEFSRKSEAHRTFDISLRRLLAFGLKFTLPLKRPMVSEVRIPAMESSLLAYRLEISGQNCNEDAELFTPLVRQFLSDPYESRFYVNAHQADVSIHGVAPYMPPPLRQNIGKDKTLSFQFWTDPTCKSNVHVRVTFDLLGSMGKLYMRYRTVFAAFPTLIVALVLRRQFRVYDETGVFVSFSESLDMSLRKSIPAVLASLTLLSLSLGAPETAQPSDGLWNWRNATDAVIDFHRNDLLVGTQDPFFWFLTPLIGVICVFACVALNYVVLAVTYILGFVFSLASFRSGWVRHGDRRRGSSVQQSVADAKGQPLSDQPLQAQAYFNPAFIQSTPRRRIITTAVLLFLVSTCIPYQFAYLVACIVQLATTVRAQRLASDLWSTVNYNFYNYAHSILILMLWVLPINLPILVVWVRNLAVHWFTPFSSHHNVLSIMSFIVLVETLTTGRMVPRVTTRLKHVTSILLFGVAICAALYGVSYAYLIHYLANLAVGWLVIIHSTGEPDAWTVNVFSGIFDDGSPDGKQGKSP